MSGRPNPPQVGELRAAAARIRELDDDVRKLRAQIDAANVTLQAAEFERRKLAETIIELMRKMDVAADGNSGWENRVVWFLSELATQAEQYGRAHL